jgi:ADP-glucose pyrophosphorylase
VVIEEGALVEDSVLWQGSRIGRDSQVRRSIVAGARVAQRASIGDAIVMPGRPARVAAMEPPAR